MSSRSRLLVTAAVLAWCGYTALLGVLYALLPPNPDEAIFDYIGWVISQGGKLYVDVAEQNFPGKMWLHAVSTWMFGNHAWSYRLFDYLLLLPTCWVLYLIARRVLASGAWVVVPVYQSMYVTAGAWAAGTRDLVASHMLVAGGFAYFLRTTGRSGVWLGAYGGLCAAAVLTRPTYALFVAIVPILDLGAAWWGHGPWRKALVRASIGSGIVALLLASVALAGWRTGQLQEWYSLAIRYNLGVYSHSASFLEVSYSLFTFVYSWHWYLAYGLAGCCLWWREQRARGLWMLTVLTAMTAVLSAYAQRKGFGYHFVGFLPAIGLFVAYFMVWSVARVRGLQDRGRLCGAILVVAVAVAGLLKKEVGQLGPQLSWLVGNTSRHEMMAAHGYADTFEMGQLVARTVPAEGGVLVWSRKLHVNYLAERRSPTRFITVWMLDGLPADFSLGRIWEHEFEQDFLAQQPEVIVLDDSGEGREGLLTRESPSAVVRFLRDQIRANYLPETSVGSLSLFRLRRKG